MIPSFKESNYYEGIDKATDVLMALAAGEYSFESYNDSVDVPAWIAFLPFIIVIIIIIAVSKSRNNHTNIGGRKK